MGTESYQEESVDSEGEDSPGNILPCDDHHDVLTILVTVTRRKVTERERIHQEIYFHVMTTTMCLLYWSQIL